ncbi:MAG: RNA 2',3'-cyclic phosphodiesterase [Leptothrix sp. (in: Bacteria)]|nr:RNA 2',3'-cyclic phosphodiesterase [Leptothrix sp. (in: b-proteobacteria)]
MPDPLPTGPTADPRPAAARHGAARLFVALWPPSALAAALHAQALALTGTQPGAGRCEAAVRLHLTLLFIGPVPRARLPALQAALCLPFSPFELQLAACTRWRPGLVVAEPTTVPAALLALQAALAQAAAALGLRCEARAFRPHLTLVRRHAGPWPAAAVVVQAPRWRVRSYRLVESLPGPPACYRVLQTCAASPSPSGDACACSTPA